MAKFESRYQPPAKRSSRHQMESGREEWLTLKDASEFLGVHFTTLRKWADGGELPVFRTPGGHRRFSLADLRRFLAERVSQDLPSDSDSVLTVAVDRVREELQRMPQEHAGWANALSEAERDLSRQRGRQLFSLAIAYVVKPGQRERILADGRRLGFEYGHEAALHGLGLMETGRAVQFFRSQFNQALRTPDHSSILDADDLRVQQIIDQFLDEVLYAVLSGYEETMQGEQQTSSSFKRDEECKGHESGPNDRGSENDAPFDKSE